MRYRRIHGIGAAAVFLLLVLLAAIPAAAEETTRSSTLPVASDEAAEEALRLFNAEYKARGLKGDEKLSQRDYAMRRLTRTQHPEVAARLAKLAKSRDEMLRTLAVIYLGDQAAAPGAAGVGVLAAMKRHKKDDVFVLSGLQSIGQLRYLGARKELCALLAHDDFSRKKAAIASMGETRDLRLMKRLLRIVGIDYKPGEGGPDDDGEGDSVVVTPGYSWEGVDVFIPYSGSGDEEAERERIGQEMIAENKRRAQAEAAAGAQVTSADANGSSGSVSSPRGARSRDGGDLIPPAVVALRRMTGQPFNTPADVVKWLKSNKRAIRDRCRELEVLERRQRRGEPVH